MNATTLCRVLFILSWLAASAAHAQIPEPLNYQGYLVDSSGQALDDPTTVSFSLYTVASGGSAQWTDTQLILPDQGLFAAELGSVANPFPIGLFDTPLWLGVTVGSDAEMTPRRALRSAAYAKKAADALSLGGLSPAAFDQSGDITSLNVSVATLDDNVNNITNEVSVLNADLSTVEVDLNSVENALPTLQSRVTGTCPTGSSIRTISSSGSVSCETDDEGPWFNSGVNPYVTSGTRVGIGTTAPAASIQIDAPLDTDPFRARVASSTKLRVHTNGSVSVGTSAQGPENGLYVQGQMGVGTSSPAARSSIADTNWQMSLLNNDVGGSQWFIGSSADAWAAGGGKLIFAPTNNSNSSAMTITGLGNIGIDNNDPQAHLHVSGGSDVNTVSGGYAIFGSNTGSQIAIDNNEIMARSGGSATTLALNAEGGTVTINSGGGANDDTVLEVTGQAIFESGQNSSLVIGRTNSSPTNLSIKSSLFEEGLVGELARPWWRIYSREFYASSPIEYRTYSDASLKRNVQPIGNALDTIMRLDGVQYELMKHPFDDSQRERSAKDQFDQANQLGFIAQDLEKVLPQLVKEDADSGLKTVGYMGVLPILVEAIKEQQRHIEQQEARIAELEKRLQ
ncbi:MAG: tail fiber domain-containing protein [Gammaproteobacteria bacterium]